MVEVDRIFKWIAGGGGGFLTGSLSQFTDPYKMVLDRDGWVLQLLENRRLFLIDGGGRKL